VSHRSERRDQVLAVGGTGSFTASLVAADGRVYFTSEEGEVVVIAAGREPRVPARSELGAPALATPAIAGGMIVFRTAEELIGVGFTASAGKPAR
jgi:hypothetical protein